MKKLFKITVKPECLEECLALITEHTVACRSDRGNLISEAYQSQDDPASSISSAPSTPRRTKSSTSSPRGTGPLSRKCRARRPRRWRC